MQWISRHVVLRELPARQVVIRFELRGRSRHRYWLVLRTDEASLCPEHPGFPEDVYVTSTPAELYRLVVGKQSLEHAMDEGTRPGGGPTPTRPFAPAMVSSSHASGPAVGSPR